MANRWGESKNSDIFSWFSKSLWAVTATTKLKHTCSLEEKLWKTETVLESGDITLPTKAHIVKAVTYPVVINRHESWIIKNFEHWRTDAFELWCWRRLLRVPWTARRSKPSILKEIDPEYSLEGLMLKLRLQYFCHLRWRADSLVKTLMLGKIEGKRRRGWQGMRCLDGFIDSMDMSLNNRDIVKDREAWYGAVCGVTKSRTQLSD